MKNILVIIGVCVSFAAMSQEIRFSGVIGQSQPSASEPCATLWFQGVAMDAAGRLWAAPGGNRLLVFSRDSGNAWRMDGSVSLPATTAGRTAVWFNGNDIIAWLGDNRVALIAPEAKSVTKTVPLPEKTSSVFVPSSPGTGAGRFSLLALSGRTVFGVRFDGSPTEELLTMPDLREVLYTSVGLDPASGDIIAGTPYPFQKIYRFAGDGSQVGKDSWPRQGWPVQFIASQGVAWFVNQNGNVSPLSSSASQRKGAASALQVEFGTSCQGAAFAADGTWWCATSQGLLNIGSDGVVITRLGGVTDVRCLAITRAGEIVAMVEKGQRAIRFLIDDSACSAPRSRGNEPWRVGGNWKDRGASIAPDGGGYFVLDEEERRLWRFDPERTVWGDLPWTPLNDAASFEKPTSLTVGDLFVWVVDNGKLLQSDRRSIHFTATQTVYPEGFSPIHSAAADDSSIYLASETKVIALERKSDASYAIRWASPVPIKKSVAIAADERCVVVADAEAAELVVLDSANGAVRAKITAKDVPGMRFAPSALAFRSPWLVVADQAGARLLRFRVIDSH